MNTKHNLPFHNTSLQKARAAAAAVKAFTSAAAPSPPQLIPACQFTSLRLSNLLTFQGNLKRFNYNSHHRHVLLLFHLGCLARLKSWTESRTTRSRLAVIFSKKAGKGLKMSSPPFLSSSSFEQHHPLKTQAVIMLKGNLKLFNYIFFCLLFCYFFERDFLFSSSVV